MAKEDHQQLEDLFDLALKEAQQPEDHMYSLLSLGLTNKAVEPFLLVLRMGIIP